MFRSCIALLAIVSGLILQAEDSARTAAPSYSATDIVNSATKTPGPLAPNSLATIFGKDLTFVTEEAGHVDRNELAGARVLVRGVPAQLLKASPTQIDFVVPNWLRPADVKVRVVRQGVAGPEVVLTLLDAAPALFPEASGYAIATHADYSSITED